MITLSRNEFDAGCLELDRLIVPMALAKLEDYGYMGVLPVEDAPQTYAETKRLHRTLTLWGSALWPVYALYSDDTVHQSPEVNHLSRGMHDMSHLELDVGYDFHSEMAVARYESEALPAGLARRIFWADSAGMSEFSFVTGGKFPLRQRQFVYDYLTRGRHYTFTTHRRWMV